MDGRSSKDKPWVSFGFPLKNLTEGGVEMKCVCELGGKSFCLSDKEMTCKPDMAIYIDKQHNVWGLSEDLAMAMVDTYEGNVEIAGIPETDFIVIYDENDVLELAGHKYILYDCLVMKSTDKGLRALDSDEIEIARQAFRKQTARYQAGPFSFNAYKIS